jgi:hypothetical protein
MKIQIFLASVKKLLFLARKDFSFKSFLFICIFFYLRDCSHFIGREENAEQTGKSGAQKPTGEN